MRLAIKVDLDVETPRWLRSFPAWARRGAAVVGALLVAAPLVALAGDRFSDVPDTNVFHNAINQINDAGITIGCAPGKYCPGDPVTRDQMAGFLGRGLGTIAQNTGLLRTTLAAPDQDQPVVRVAINVPGVGSAAVQNVLVTGQVSMQYSGSQNNNCPCNVRAFLREFNNPSNNSALLFDQIPAATPVGQQLTVGRSWVFSAGPGLHSYELVVRVEQATLNFTLSSGVAIAQTVPFRTTQGQTQAPGS